MYVIIHHLALAADEVFEGSVELDESYFGGQRKGRRGRGAAGKVVVFGILKRNGRVYTVVVDNAKSETLFPVIKKKIMPDSIVYTDSLSSYDKLDVSGFIHYRINHSKEFVDRQNHINGIENFFNFMIFCKESWRNFGIVSKLILSTMEKQKWFYHPVEPEKHGQFFPGCQWHSQ